MRFWSLCSLSLIVSVVMLILALSSLSQIHSEETSTDASTSTSTTSATTATPTTSTPTTSTPRIPPSPSASMNLFFSHFIENWGGILLYVSILTGIVQFINFIFGIDMMSKFMEWRDKNYYDITIDSVSHSRLYNQILKYLSKDKKMRQSMNHVRVGKDGEFATEESVNWSDEQNGMGGIAMAVKSIEKEEEEDEEERESSKGNTNNESAFGTKMQNKLAFAPGFGNFHFNFPYQFPSSSAPQNIKIWLTHTAPQQQSYGGSSRFMSAEYHATTISLQVEKRHKMALHAFIKQCNSKYLQSLSSKILIFTYQSNSWPSGFKCILKEKRKIDGIIIGAKANKLIEDARQFFHVNTKKYYQQLHIPYRRGFLLFSKPGMGKSSYVSCLASELNRPIYFISLNDNRLDDSTFSGMFTAIPQGSIILLEDIDCLTKSREGSGGEGESKEEEGDNDNEEEEGDGTNSTTTPPIDGTRVSLSALLNCLDGVAAYEGSLVILTSNHPERLDPALVRSGRIDVKLEFFPPGVMEAMQLVVKMMKVHKVVDVEREVRRLRRKSEGGDGEGEGEENGDAAGDELPPMVSVAVGKENKSNNSPGSPQMIRGSSNIISTDISYSQEDYEREINIAMKHLKVWNISKWNEWDKEQKEQKEQEEKEKEKEREREKQKEKEEEEKKKKAMDEKENKDEKHGEKKDEKLKDIPSKVKDDEKKSKQSELIASPNERKLHHLISYLRSLRPSSSSISSSPPSLPPTLTFSSLLLLFRLIFYTRQYCNRSGETFINYADIQSILLQAHTSLGCECIQYAMREEKDGTQISPPLLSSFLPCLINFVCEFFDVESDKEKFAFKKKEKERKKKVKKDEERRKKKEEKEKEKKEKEEKEREEKEKDKKDKEEKEKDEKEKGKEKETEKKDEAKKEDEITNTDTSAVQGKEKKKEDQEPEGEK